MSQSTAAEITVKSLLTEEEIFQWSKQWYPIAVIEFLDPTRPHGTQLLGKDVTFGNERLS